MTTTLNKSDFSVTVTAEGYMISYKGNKIGGASIIGKSKSRGKARQEDIKMYNDASGREVENLCRGVGRKDMIESIVNINKH